MRALALTACLVLVPSAASARSVTVVVGDAPSPLEMRAIVIEAIAERGVRLVRTPDGEICDGDAEPCAAELAARTGADATLRVDVIEGEPAQVHVRLVPAEGDTVSVQRAVEDAGLAAAVRAAIEQVLEVAPAAVGFLVVRSQPAGARVHVDGVEQGRTPLRLTLSPGPHDVRLSGAGVNAQETSVEIIANQETSLDPEPSDAESQSGPTEPDADEDAIASRSEPSPFNWFIGGALALGGVVTLISPLSTIAREGQCEERIEDVGCVEMVRFGAQSGVLLGVGLALLVAAVVVDAVAPIRVEVSASSTAAFVRVSGAF